jgi:hypothetical protein
MKPIRNIIIPFTAGVVLINFLVVALLGLQLRESRIQYEKQDFFTELSSGAR